MTFIEALSSYPPDALPGKRFRRAWWDGSHVETNANGIIFYCYSKVRIHLNLAVGDMLATDWEEVK